MYGQTEARRAGKMNRRDILRWLREGKPSALDELWQLADRTRRQGVGDEVHLHGVVEVSNHCNRSCLYCGLRLENTAFSRYRMTEQEILDCAQRAVKSGYGTVVLKSGEDPGIGPDRVAGIVRRIKRDTPLAVTLSLGERQVEDLQAWRRAGADRYWLQFETSNRQLYDRIHPALKGARSNRLAMLGELRRMRYEVGGGVMVGIPGQTVDDLAGDIESFSRLNLDMIGIGPYIPHPNTPLGRGRQPCRDQAPNTEVMTYKVLALTRIVCPRASIPATAALATVNRSSGRELALQRGANAVMPNLTPFQYRRLYGVYPGKACMYESPEDFHSQIKGRIVAMGRKIAAAPGDRDRRTGTRTDV